MDGLLASLKTIIMTSFEHTSNNFTHYSTMNSYVKHELLIELFSFLNAFCLVSLCLEFLTLLFIITTSITTIIHAITNVKVKGKFLGRGGSVTSLAGNYNGSNIKF